MLPEPLAHSTANPSRTVTNIRHAALDDAASIAHVHVEAWRTAYRNILPDQILDGLSEDNWRSRWQSGFSSRRPGEFVLIAEQEGQVVGFVEGGPEREGDPQFTGEVYALYLLAEHRGQGIGTALFGKAAELLVGSGIDSMKVWVLRDNPYRRFYERLGGRHIGEKLTRIGGQDFGEVAYGWSELAGGQA